MASRLPSWRAIPVAAVLVATAGITVLPAAAGDGVESGLFAPVADVTDLPGAGEPTVLRSRVVRFDVDALRRGLDDKASRIALNLFPDAAWPAVVESTRITGPASFVSRGRLEDGTGTSGSFTVVVNGGIAAAVIDAFGAGPQEHRRFELRSLGDGDLHAVLELNQDAFGDCACGAAEVIQLPAEPLAVGADDGSLIDVMVLYTSQASSGQGGTNAIESLIDLAIETSNDVYDDSEVLLPRLRLVHKGPVSYAESGDSATDLDRLRGTADGFMDGIHDLRDTVRADLVCLLVNTTEPGNCGRAYRMTSLSSGFASSAFSVVRASCAVGNLTVTHELGHNMGLAHQDTTGTVLFPYSFGYQFFGASGSQWRTVMAIGDGNRIAFHSNPNILWDGVPAGGPLAFAALSLDNAAPTVASFRQSIDVCPPPADGAAAGIVKCIPFNNDCENAVTIGPGTIAFSTAFATTDGPPDNLCNVKGDSQVGSDIWFRYVAPCAGVVTIDLCDSSYDTRLAVYPVLCPQGANEAIACNDDFCGLQSRVSFGANGGVAYLIRVGGFLGAQGEGLLTLIPPTCIPAPPNNNCGSASPISDGLTPFTTIGATTDGPDEPEACDFFNFTQIDKDVWFRYVAPCTGKVSVNLCDADYDTKLAVYGAFCPSGPGLALACNDDACGLQSELTFDAVGGTIYRLRVGGFAGASGSGFVSVTCSEGSTCDGDTNGDGMVNVLDLLDVILFWGSADGEADVNHDGIVNVQDLLAVILEWGPC